MHNIHDLEQRWLKYKIKFYLPYIITIIFTIILSIALVFILDTKKDSDAILASTEIVQTQTPLKPIVKKKIVQEKVPEHIENKVEKIIKKQTSVENIAQEKQLVLTPSLDFMKKLKTDSVNSYQSQKPRTNEVQKVYEPIVNEQKTTTKFESIPKKQKINISTKETQNDIQHVIKRFKKNNNPTLSLFVAKKYYKLGDYRKAYNYALITNEINNEIEQSWIIFAKSLVKLKKKNLAIKTLSKYVNHSHSGNAKVLLDDIKSGKFK